MPAAPQAIDPVEHKFLAYFIVVALLVGLVGGIALALSLTGDQVVQGSYWSELLKVVGVAALPLVALAVRFPRTSGKATWSKSARKLVLVAFPIALGTIGLCLNRVAETPKDGADAPDLLLYLSGAGAGLVLAAVAVGVAADVLDKVDT